MGLPLVVVARPGLGTLNHTLLTLQGIRHFQLPIRGVIINHTQPPSGDPMARLAERTNPAILAKFTRVLGQLPFQPDLYATSLAQWFSQHVDMNDGLVVKSAE